LTKTTANDGKQQFIVRGKLNNDQKFKQDPLLRIYDASYRAKNMNSPIRMTAQTQWRAVYLNRKLSSFASNILDHKILQRQGGSFEDL